MTAAMAMPGNTAETFLVHFFGIGLRPAWAGLGFHTYVGHGSADDGAFDSGREGFAGLEPFPITVLPLGRSVPGAALLKSIE